MSHDRDARAALEAAQARLRALRERLHAPIDTTPFEAEIADRLRELELEKHQLVDEHLQLQRAIDELRPQAEAASDHLERLRTGHGVSPMQVVLTAAAGGIAVLVVMTSDDLPSKPFVLWPLLVAALLAVPAWVLIRASWRAGLAAGARRLTR